MVLSNSSVPCGLCWCTCLQWGWLCPGILMNIFYHQYQGISIPSIKVFFQPLNCCIQHRVAGCLAKLAELHWCPKFPHLSRRLHQVHLIVHLWAETGMEGLPWLGLLPFLVLGLVPLPVTIVSRKRILPVHVQFMLRAVLHSPLTEESYPHIQTFLYLNQ